MRRASLGFMWVAAMSLGGLGAMGGLGATGCGGDDGNNQIVIIDGGSGGGDGGGGATCNPVSQTGCATDEKCANVTIQEADPNDPNSEPILITACVPDGDKPGGSSCGDVAVTGDVNGTTNDCVAGYECTWDVACLEICSRLGGSGAQGSCAGTTDICARFTSLFPGVDDVGLCLLGCDAAGQDCVEGLNCYLNLGDGAASCAVQILSGAEMAGHGESCGDCNQNACDEGSGSHGLSISVTEMHTNFASDLSLLEGGEINHCQSYCTPDPTWLDDPAANQGNAQGANGLCSATQECRYANGFWWDLEDPTGLPDTLGLCYDTQDSGLAKSWGTCVDHDIDAFRNILTEVPQGTPGFENFIPGCSTSTQLVENLDAAAPAPATGSAKKIEVKAKFRTSGISFSGVSAP